MQNLLHNHIEACKVQQEVERARTEQVAELNSRAIFLGALGTVPIHLQQEVNSLLSEGKK